MYLKQHEGLDLVIDLDMILNYLLYDDCLLSLGYVWVQSKLSSLKSSGVRMEGPIQLICLKLWVSEINFYAIL